MGTPPLTLDEGTVLMNFLGKNQADARKAIAEGDSTTEDFMGMAPAVLEYYITPAMEYLQSEESEQRLDFASGILCSLSFHAKEINLPRDLVAQIGKIAAYIDAHRRTFCIEDENVGLIYTGYLKDAPRGTREGQDVAPLPLCRCATLLLYQVAWLSIQPCGGSRSLRTKM